MLYWTLAFLFFALVAALFGFTNLFGPVSGLAQIIFAVLIVLYAITLTITLLKNRARPTAV